MAHKIPIVNWRNYINDLGATGPTVSSILSFFKIAYSELFAGRAPSLKGQSSEILILFFDIS
jgi:hypothetical protein